MQFLHFCFGLGAFISPLFVAWLGGKSYILFGVLSFILAIVCFFFDSPKIHKERAGTTPDKDFTPIP
jgi:fucose permease